MAIRSFDCLAPLGAVLALAMLAAPASAAGLTGGAGFTGGVGLGRPGPGVARPGWRPAHPGQHPWARHAAERRRALHGDGYGYGGLPVSGLWSAPVVSGPVPVAPPPPGPIPIYRLPTVADLPVGGVVTTPPGPPTFYVVNDRSGGRSGRIGGAKIVAVGKPVPMGDRFGPRIIELTAR